LFAKNFIRGQNLFCFAELPIELLFFLQFIYLPKIYHCTSILIFTKDLSFLVQILRIK